MTVDPEFARKVLEVVNLLHGVKLGTAADVLASAVVSIAMQRDPGNIDVAFVTAVICNLEEAVDAPAGTLTRVLISEIVN